MKPGKAELIVDEALAICSDIDRWRDKKAAEEANVRYNDMLVIASPVYFYGISAQLKAIIDRLHTPMRNGFNIKKLGLILVGAAQLPEMFDAIIAQYRLVLDFFKLEDVGIVLVRGAKDKGDVKEESLKAAFEMGRMAE